MSTESVFRSADVRSRGPIRYRPSSQNSGWTLPDGARLAVWVIPNVEFYTLDKEVRGCAGTLPDVPGFAQRDYGARVGMWRLIDAFDQFEVPITVALNSMVCDAYPELTDALRSRDYDIMGHCESNSIRLCDMDGDGERHDIERATARIREAFGEPPQGWLGSGLQETWRTLDLLGEFGYQYVADWTSDDRPDRIEGCDILSVPYTQELNDHQAFLTWRMTSDEFRDRVVRQFDTLWREGAEEPRVLALALHPFLIGVPHRIRALYEILEFLRSKEEVWWATGRDIARCYRSTSAT